jgi:hypothetical protein
MVGTVSLVGCGASSSDSNSNASAPPPSPTFNDPLFAYQWHLQNSGASAFSSTLPTTGNDINVLGAWALGYSGKGIKVGIVDSGMDVKHEDLAANVDLDHSHNFVNNSNDPTPSALGADHGTAVAGIIGAVANNGLGGVGVAFNARLRGYNLLANNNLTNQAYAFGGASYSADNDLFNGSFYYGDQGFFYPFNIITNAVLDNLGSLRGGKGAPLIKSAGNQFGDAGNSNNYSPLKDQNNNLYYNRLNELCNFAITIGVSCDDPATDALTSNDHAIVIGSLNARGVKASYSNAGSSLWVSAFGGEYGYDTAYFHPNPLPPLNYYESAIVTTNLTGCANYNIAFNALDSLGQNPLSRQCQYTATFNGTSAAAPVASGVVALLLEANPNLGYRDIKYILAKTAKRVHLNQPSITISAPNSPYSLIVDQGWKQNQAGYWFSNWYGFGQIDATAAVKMAKTYNTYLPTSQSLVLNLNAPANITVPVTTEGLVVPFQASPNFQTVEQVQLLANLNNPPLNNGPAYGVGCNQIELTSPSGTKSILLHAYTVAGTATTGGTLTPQTQLVNAKFVSNAFYGEPSNGTWTLRLLDICPSGGGTVIVANTAQNLILTGH